MNHGGVRVLQPGCSISFEWQPVLSCALVSVQIRAVGVVLGFTFRQEAAAGAAARKGTLTSQSIVRG